MLLNPLRKIWRPDAFFVNSVDSLFHKVTYLNFYIFIFPDGEVFFETRYNYCYKITFIFRLYLKLNTQLILCKYPHDNQLINLKISSIAFTNNTVKFRWFSKHEDAIRINQNVQLPEFYISNVDNLECLSHRKTGIII